jgi:hypothetical protein
MHSWVLSLEVGFTPCYCFRKPEAFFLGGGGGVYHAGM